MNLIFVGSFFPKEIKEYIERNSIGPIANANNALQFSLLEGFTKICRENINIVTLPAVGRYPTLFKKIYLPDSYFEINCINGKVLSFFNLPVIKILSRSYSLKKYLNSYIKKVTDNDLTIIVYDLHAPFLNAIASLKKKFNIKLCVIVPDIPGYTDEPDNFIYNFYKRFFAKSLDQFYSMIDSFVLISKFMTEKIPVENKPYIVMEGIFNPDDAFPIVSTSTKDILYSGAMNKRNGVLLLLEAFSLIDNPDYRLILCGDGELHDTIIEFAKQDSRIIFKGQITRELVLKLQSNSSLLINPRPNIEEFAKYSFPSKTMEYLASGIPVLMFKLDGIPEEYYNYSFTMDDLSPKAMATCIDNILQTSSDLLKQKAMRAKDFILNEKNPYMQVSKILDLIDYNK